MTELKKPSTFFARVSTSHLTEDQVAQYTSNPETVFDIIHCRHPESLTTATVLFDEASFGDELLAEVRLTDEFLDVVKSHGLWPVCNRNNRSGFHVGSDTYWRTYDPYRF